MKKHRNFATKREALARSRDILKASVQARGGKWRKAGASPDGFEYPEGEWPGKPIGNGRHCRPEIGIATHATPVKRGARRRGGRFLVEDDTGEDVADDDIFVPEPAEDTEPAPEPAQPPRKRKNR